MAIAFIGLTLAGCGGSKNTETNLGDPLYAYQWHLHNTGQAVFSDIAPTAGVDLNMTDLFEQGITGKGVTVGFAEDGAAYSWHEDLQQNMVAIDSNSREADLRTATHATATSSIIAAVANNGKGGRGVAPDARILDLTAWGNQPHAPLRLISNSAGGSPPFFPTPSDGDTPGADALELRRLQDPFATLLVHSAGNSYLEAAADTESLCEAHTRKSGIGCVVANTDLLNNLPFSIGVGAVAASGRKASYSSAGSVLWVSALGGEGGWQREQVSKRGALPDSAARHPERFFSAAIVSADAPGCDKGLNKTGAEYNQLEAGTPFDPDCNYTARANGTSAAAPMVSGIIALMLQVNPLLGWRDIKYLLATTARQIDPLQGGIDWDGMLLDNGWVTNAAGHPFSNWYGYGLADATRAVNAARSFAALPALQATDWKIYGGKPVPVPYRSDDAGMALISMPEDLMVETVHLQIKTNVQNPVGLRVTLISPAGTRSVILPPLTYLLPAADGFHIDLTGSNAFLDESSKGEWKIQITDAIHPDAAATETLVSWKLRVFGHRPRTG